MTLVLSFVVVLNGSYSNQQFLDFMLVAVRKGETERSTAGIFTVRHFSVLFFNDKTYLSHPGLQGAVMSNYEGPWFTFFNFKKICCSSDLAQTQFS